MPKTLHLLLFTPTVLATLWLLPGKASDDPRENPPDGLRLRRPIALALAEGGKRLLVANRDSGTVTVLDTQALRVVTEVRVGRKLSDLAATPDRSLVAVSDEAAGEVVLLAQRQGALRELRRVKVGISPVSVRLSEDGSLATVACLWPRRVTLVELGGPGKLREAATTCTLDLPFAPRLQLLLARTGKLLVADAFGGHLAVVNLRRKEVESVRSLTAHNIRGLALDRQGKAVLLAHQTLFAQGRPNANDIRSASLLANTVRAVSLATVLDPHADLRRDDRQFFLGDIERGAGDPAALLETAEGSVLVALAGVDELAIGRPAEALWTRLGVGRRPTAFAVDAAARRAYVANTFDDSVSVVDLGASRVAGKVALGPPADLRPHERGELLFHDARLSFESWFSCHSCHPDGHSNGRLNDNFSDGSFGTPKRVLSLLGAKDTGPWAWNGQMADLETQVRNSVRSTMQGGTLPAEQVRDLAAYLRTLPPPPSLLEARGAVDAEAVKRGRKVFSRQKCASCHGPPTYTSAKTYDVGLRDEAGGTHFNPPSLRGLSQAGPYFHDGRAASLEDVFARHRHQLSGPLSQEELRDLLHFLRSL